MVSGLWQRPWPRICFPPCAARVQIRCCASTYLGGSDRELAPSTVVAADGSIFLALATASPDLPATTGAAQTALATGTCSGGDPEGRNFPRRCFDAYILYATGLGTVDGPVTSCGAPGNPPQQVTAMVTVHTGWDALKRHLGGARSGVRRFVPGQCDATSGFRRRVGVCELPAGGECGRAGEQLGIGLGIGTLAPCVGGQSRLPPKLAAYTL
jgi:hypothetical protein